VNAFMNHDTIAILLIDLDGTVTINEINNTFDFLLYCYKHRFGKIGLILYKVLTFLLQKFLLLIPINEELIAKDSFIIAFHLRLLKLFSSESNFLLLCSLKWILHVLKKKLIKTDTLLLIAKWGGIKILFTACIDVVACNYAKLLKLSECYARRTYPTIDLSSINLLKFKFLSYILKKYKHLEITYVLDKVSYENEKRLMKYINKHIVA
jgi:hypothetical protein